MVDLSELAERQDFRSFFIKGPDENKSSFIPFVVYPLKLFC